MTIENQHKSPLIYLIPIKCACYKVFMVTVLDCIENVEDITQLFVQYQNLPTIMKPSLFPRVPRDRGFLRP